MSRARWMGQMAHWGAYEARTDGEDIVAVRADRRDPEPSRILGNIPGMVSHPARVTRPAVRAGWLERGPGPSSARGDEPFVDVDWDVALDLVAGQLQRVLADHDPTAVYGGSYGWSSAGRFHHAQSQVHRFLNTLGGYTRSVNSYSSGTSEVLLPHVLGSAGDVYEHATTWDVIEQHTRLMVAFGGISPKNSDVAGGGILRHVTQTGIRAARHAGMDLVTVSPIRVDSAMGDWQPIAPGTDVALILALCSVLIDEDLVDRDFVERCTVGADVFIAYVTHGRDGRAFDPRWAEEVTGIPAGRIRLLARRMAATRTMITVSWSLQRARHGEQPVWAALALASLLGQIGLPGGGFTHGYGSSASMGLPIVPTKWPTFSQGRNPTGSFIPVARIADMLLHPGEEYEYDGRTLTYPAIALMYWAGGNPFHHHQDLARLRSAISRLDTFVVNESHWTATARHADVVLPATTAVERIDLGAMSQDDTMIAMHRVVPPYAEARDDFAIFAALADRLGVGRQFSEGHTADEWVERIYDEWADRNRETIPGIPSFAEFWRIGSFTVPNAGPTVQFDAFRADPAAHPLPTPSGRIELFSSTISGFGYEDCPGHPAWFEPERPPEADHYPLRLLANQPKTRLHSQLDMGETSRRSKIAGREPLTMHPVDAAARGILDGDVVEVTSPRGLAVSAVRIADEVIPGVVQLSTGAWYAPLGDGSVCVHGNPNVLTDDIGSSRLSQGTTGGNAWVEVRRAARAWPRPDVHRRPAHPVAGGADLSHPIIDEIRA